MNKLILTAAAVLLAGPAFMPTVQAAPIGTNGDILLGFRINSGSSTGFADNVEVDLGPISNFTSSENVINLNSALTSVYGSSYDTNSNLVFSIVGVSGTNIEYLSDPNNSTNVPNLASTIGSQFASNIPTLSGPYAEDTTSGTSLGNGVYEFSYADPASYTAQIRNSQTTNGPQPFNTDYNIASFSQFVNGTTEEGVTASPASLDLYTVFGTGSGKKVTYSATDLGTFSLQSNGELVFSVPEPSTYAMLALGGLVLLFVRRRMMA